MRQFKDALLAPIADIHAGGSTALFPPHQMELLVGNRSPGYMQDIIRRQWQEVIDNINKRRIKRRLIIVLNGDMVDGNHHGSVENYSPLMVDQIAIAEELIDELLTGINFGKSDQLYMTKGTYAHVGIQAQAEESIAKNFGAIPFIPEGRDEPARYLWYQVKLNINNVKYQIQHEGARIGSRPWTQDNGMNLLLKSKYWKHLLGEHELADWYIYAHLHNYLQATYEPKPGIKLNARMANENIIRGEIR